MVKVLRKYQRYKKVYYVFRYTVNPKVSEAEQMFKGSLDECVNYIKYEHGLPGGIYSVEEYDYRFEEYQMKHLFRHV